ncbi:32276_t:CDS:1, partial [Gigaspora margarita]
MECRCSLNSKLFKDCCLKKFTFKRRDILKNEDDFYRYFYSKAGSIGVIPPIDPPIIPPITPPIPDTDNIDDTEFKRIRDSILRENYVIAFGVGRFWDNEI